jgi:ADP-ribose pyrophosphatase YjhB (NUDIX family)
MNVVQNIKDFFRWEILGRLRGENKNVVCAVIMYQNKILAQTAQRNKSIHTDDSQYVVPGGKVEPKETLNAAVHREIKEETNLNIDVIKKLGTSRNNQYKLHWFACTPTDVSLLKVVEPLKQKELKWVDLDDTSVNWTPKNLEAMTHFKQDIQRLIKELEQE